MVNSTHYCLKKVYAQSEHYYVSLDARYEKDRLGGCIQLPMDIMTWEKRVLGVSVACTGGLVYKV